MAGGNLFNLHVYRHILNLTPPTPHLSHTSHTSHQHHIKWNQEDAVPPHNNNNAAASPLHMFWISRIKYSSITLFPPASTHPLPMAMPVDLLRQTANRRDITLQSRHIAPHQFPIERLGPIVGAHAPISYEYHQSHADTIGGDSVVIAGEGVRCHGEQCHGER